MKTNKLRQFIREAIEENAKACPAPTQDVGLNTANRDRAIQADFIKYGPLNVEEPGDYWERYAKRWNTTAEVAKKSNCSNCVAFDISPRMEKCMPLENMSQEEIRKLKSSHKFEVQILEAEVKAKEVRIEGLEKLKTPPKKKFWFSSGLISGIGITIAIANAVN